MDRAAVRVGAMVAGVVVLCWLLALSVGGTMAWFSSRAEGTVTISAGELTILGQGLDQQYAALLPGVPQDRTFGFTSASTGPIDVYLWVEPVGGGADYCDAAVAPFLQARITEGAATLLDWTSVCDLVNTVARSGAAAPLTLATDVAPGAQRQYTIALRLHPDADEALTSFQRTGDRFVLYATQDIAPAPAPAGPVAAPAPPPLLAPEAEAEGEPTEAPTPVPSEAMTDLPTGAPTPPPGDEPSDLPSDEPTDLPTDPSGAPAPGTTPGGDGTTPDPGEGTEPPAESPGEPTPEPGATPSAPPTVPVDPEPAVTRSAGSAG